MDAQVPRTVFPSTPLERCFHGNQAARRPRGNHDARSLPGAAQLCTAPWTRLAAVHVGGVRQSSRLLRCSRAAALPRCREVSSASDGVSHPLPPLPSAREARCKPNGQPRASSAHRAAEAPRPLATAHFGPLLPGKVRAIHSLRPCFIYFSIHSRVVGMGCFWVFFLVGARARGGRGLFTRDVRGVPRHVTLT